ncbi:MAG: hypothetical protein ACE5IJ_10550 [Thermoplasmata archaeon]
MAEGSSLSTNLPRHLPLAALVVAALFLLPMALGQREISLEEAVDIALDLEEVRDVFSDDVEITAEFHEEGGYWLVQLFRDDERLAFVTVSSDGDVLEVGIRESEGREEGEEPWFPFPWASDSALFLFGGSIFLLAFWDFGRKLSLRNLGLLLMLSLAPGILYFWRNLHLSVVLVYLPFVFLTLFLVLFLRKRADGVRPNFPTGVMKAFTLLFFLYGVGLTLTGGVDDSGWFGSIGGEMMLKGELPYGRLEGGDTYGPLHYMLFAPLVGLFSESEWAEYNPAARILTIAFSLLLVFGLKKLGDSYGEGRGWSLSFAWVVLPYTLFMMRGSEVSHVFPAALSMWAFIYLSRPIASGGLLALAAETEFFPALYFPLWLSRHSGGDSLLPNRKGWVFLGSFVAVNLLILSPVLASPGGLSTFLRSTVLFQEGGGPGSFQSIWGIWGQYPDLRIVKLPIMAASLILYLGLYFYPVKKTRHTLLGLTALVILVIHLWKTHLGVGGYVTWFLPFFLGAVLLGSSRRWGKSTKQGAG